MTNKAERTMYLESQVHKLLEMSNSINCEETKEWFLEILKLIEEFASSLKESSLSDKEAYLAQEDLRADIDTKLLIIQEQILNYTNTKNTYEISSSDFVEEFETIRQEYMELMKRMEDFMCIYKIHGIFWPEQIQRIKEFAEKEIII